MTVKAHYIKMLETRKACDDDNLNLVLTFYKDQSYYVGPELHEVIIREKWGKDAKEPCTSDSKDESKVEEKSKKSAPENKSLPGASENKG